MEDDRKYETDKYDASALLRGFGNTAICVFMYYPLEKRIEVPRKACDKYHCSPEYFDMPYSFADDFVHPEDYPAFLELYHKIDEGEETATASFHSKDKSACCRVTLTALSKNKEGLTKEVLGIIEDISDWDKNQQEILMLKNQLNEIEDDKIKEARVLISNAISSQFFALYHIWVETRTYVCFQEQLQGILSVIGATGAYEPAWESYIANYIVPEDQPGMTKFADINTLADRLKDKHMISHEYRRKEIGWTRGQFIVAKRNEYGEPTNIIYTVIDINAEKTMEIAQDKAIFESLHDPLTGAFNRKALEEITSSPKIQEAPIGFAIVDVDNFKIANDVFGHEIGDDILKEIAEVLKNIFRSEDYVFRIGGDEFAVLLYKCTSSGWDTLCEKQHHIHMALSQLYKEFTVTLSLGIAFSANGYNEEVFHLADERLYDVKRRGRAGSGMIDIQTGKTEYWKDDELTLKTKNILEFNNTGLYRIEYPLDTNIPPRLICGDMTRELLAFSKEDTPEECYRKWLENIDPSYLETLAETRQALMNGIQAECTYKWNHPTLGKIYVRTGGSGEVVDGVQILRGYHHTMQDTKIMERKDESQLMLDSMSAIYFCSYYVDLERDSYYTLKNAPGEKMLELQEYRATDALNQFISALVEPEYLEKMTEFMNLRTLQERMEQEVHLDCEYLSRTDKGWCRATFFPVKRKNDGTLTHVLFVITSLDERKAKEAKKGADSRKSIETLYNNVPGGIVMYEWDGKHLKTLHLSAYYEKEYGYTLNVGEEGDRGPDFNYVHPEDIADYQKAIITALNETHEMHYDFRRWNKHKGAYAWIHIDATSTMQSDGTSLVYALYTDVTEQKHLELDLEKSHESMAAALGASNLLSYEYDPVAHLGTCFTDENYFGLPKVIENYPDSLKEIDLFHPDDVDTFINTAHQMDKEVLRSHCEVRIKRNGHYRWYACSFNSYFDIQKEYNVAILTVVDISEHVSIIDDYKNRLESVAEMVENSLVIGQSNLTDNTVDFFKASDEMQIFVEGVKTFDERIARNYDYIVGEKAKNDFSKMFNRKNLLELAERGQLHVSMEYLLRIPGRNTIWIETGVNMVRNPLSGEITAISYSKDIQEVRISALLLKKTLQQDYLMSIVVLAETDEFHIVNQQYGESVEFHSNFWEHLELAMKPLLEQKEKLPQGLCDKATILGYLENNEEYTYLFDSRYGGSDSRVQLRISYLNKEQQLLFVSLRNITDK